MEDEACLRSAGLDAGLDSELHREPRQAARLWQMPHFCMARAFYPPSERDISDDGFEHI